jgi:hypothetical protein
MSESNTTELKSEFIHALDYMMDAHPRNSNKHIKVREWFTEVFKAHGRASRVSESKQAYNRVPEQFKHRDQHVIFVVDDDGTGTVIEAQVKAKQYPGLDSCLVLKKGPGGYNAVVLMIAKESPVVDFFKIAYPGVRVERLGRLGESTEISVGDKSLEEIHEFFCDEARRNGLHIEIDTALRFTSSLLSKRFAILTGLSGSGKTKLAQAFAQWISSSETCYEIIPVGADWTGNENILGYPNGLDSETYVSKPALDLIIRAQENDEVPHFLILDEMNLSHVERYFADILSAIESEEEIQLYDGGDRQAGEKRIPNRVDLPKNLFIIGTVNVDETTYMFSPKVLDRANVIEFRMDYTELGKFLGNPAKPNLSELNRKGRAFQKAFVKAANNEVTVPEIVKSSFDAEILLLFKTLQEHGAEFGYRTAYETARFIRFYQLLGNYGNDDNDWFVDAIDCVIFQKLLPKLHGSRAKLGPVLKALWFLCVNDWPSRAATAKRLNTGSDGSGVKSDESAEEKKVRLADEVKAVPSKEIPEGSPYPMSAEKIYRMWRLMMDNGFASFAEA